MAIHEYTVIIYPAAPPTRGLTGLSTYTVATPTRVLTVKADNPFHAANLAKIGPGERCQVVVDGQYFSRAEQAPIEYCDARGTVITEGKA